MGPLAGTSLRAIWRQNIDGQFTPAVLQGRKKPEYKVPSGSVSPEAAFKIPRRWVGVLSRFLFISRALGKP